MMFVYTVLMLGKINSVEVRGLSMLIQDNNSAFIGPL